MSTKVNGKSDVIQNESKNKKAGDRAGRKDRVVKRSWLNKKEFDKHIYLSQRRKRNFKALEGNNNQANI